MEQSLYWYIGSLYKRASTYSTALTREQVGRKVLFPPCLIPSSTITNKDNLTKENRKIRQSLNENEYQESIISKVRITNLSQHVTITTANTIHRYPRGKDQNEYKFTAC